MASNTHPIAPRKIERTALAHFMTRALKECSRVVRRFDADSVHDLRVALRRSRTIADGLAYVDPDKTLRALKKSSRPLFKSLGNLRDVQVILEWIEKLAPEGDPLKPRIREISRERRSSGKNGSRGGPRRFRRAPLAQMVEGSRRKIAPRCCGQPSFPTSGTRAMDRSERNASPSDAKPQPNRMAPRADRAEAISVHA